MSKFTLLLGAIFYASASFAGNVSGSIKQANGAPVKDAIVWFSGSTKAHPLAKAVVDQRNKIFEPHVMAITVGTRVDFPNNDNVYHNVFAYFDAKRFDLGMYPKGEKKSQIFNKTGLVALLCNVHSEMSAYIMVVDTPYYAVSNRSGQFKIPSNMPSGAYTVHVWHEGGSKTTQKVTVGAAESTFHLTIKR